jgi:pimeloyl-ACP methyl ester carboxylesterase
MRSLGSGGGHHRDGVEIAYTERGSGPLVVFVPGGTMFGEGFEHQQAWLDTSFRVPTFDPRTHARSTVTGEGNSYPQQGRDLMTVLDAPSLARVHFVGWALRAWCATRRSPCLGREGLLSLTVLDETP